MDEIDRRELLRRAGVGAAGLGMFGLAGCGGNAETAARAAASETVAAIPASAAIAATTVRKGEVPNLLLVIIDSVRADALGSFGRRNAHTPSLDALARESLRFTSHYPESFPTGPARATIFGGRRLYPFRGWSAPKDMPTTPGWQDVPAANVIRTLRSAGYWTAGAADTPWVLVGSQKPYRDSYDRFVSIEGQTGTITHDASGISDAELAHWVPPKILTSSSGQKMRQYLANQQGRRSEEDYLPARVFRAGMRLLAEGARQKKPWALVLDCFDPHEPWDPPDRYINLHGGDLSRPWQPGTVLNGLASSSGLSRADLPALAALYRAELSMSDHWFGNFMTKLNELKLERETLVVFLSDHGFLLGERGYVAKPATQLHPELVHTPMMIRHPDGRAAHKVNDEYVQTQDVAATLLGAAGIPRPAFMDGANLLPLLDKRPHTLRRDHVTGAYSSVVFARDRRWAYMSDNQNKDPHLYDTTRDRREVRDLAKGNPRQVRSMYRGMVVADAGGRSLPKFR
jgi:arylsulfatase A-like enzyme